MRKELEGKGMHYALAGEKCALRASGQEKVGKEGCAGGILEDGVGRSRRTITRQRGYRQVLLPDKNGKAVEKRERIKRG